MLIAANTRKYSGVMQITVAIRNLVVSPRHQLHLGDFTMNTFVEGFLRETADKAEAHFCNIIWVAVSASLGLLASMAIVVGANWF